MTWWGAVGLALALYGVVMLLEWLYERILVDGHRQAAVSVVVRVVDEVDRVEYVARELRRLVSHQGDGHWEIIWLVRQARAETRAIIERIASQSAGFRMLDADEGEVLTCCRYPLIVWVDLSRERNQSSLMGAVRQVLTHLAPPSS
ncbi:MAG: hypothetical protein OWU84_09770 [Firmicutes bacterium]|nr:hypothetical protein [Bacillota bacterium]